MALLGDMERGDGGDARRAGKSEAVRCRTFRGSGGVVLEQGTELSERAGDGRKVCVEGTIVAASGGFSVPIEIRERVDRTVKIS